jgi:hypothetical protein
VSLCVRAPLQFVYRTKLNSDSQNDQITTQNVVSVTPRFSLENYELYSWSNNEISGITGGFGFRVYGFI